MNKKKPTKNKEKIEAKSNKDKLYTSIKKIL